MEIKAFFDPETFTMTYVIYDDSSRQAAIIDPVLDYEPASSRIRSKSMQEILQFVAQSKLKPIAVLETHAHADHLSSSQQLKKHFPQIKVMINERIVKVQKIFKDVFNLERNFPTDGSQFDGLLKMNETTKIGSLRLKVLPTPGHTPACSSFLFEDQAVFTGDALFMPDYGTGRCDFPGGSASDLFDSITSQLYSLPDETRVLVGHDYQPGGRALAYESTIADQKKSNIRIRTGTRKEDFVREREKRDAELSAPRLLLPSVQFNIRAGHLPPPEENERSYFKLPIELQD